MGHWHYQYSRAPWAHISLYYPMATRWYLHGLSAHKMDIITSFQNRIHAHNTWGKDTKCPPSQKIQEYFLYIYKCPTMPEHHHLQWHHTTMVPPHTASTSHSSDDINTTITYQSTKWSTSQFSSNSCHDIQFNQLLGYWCIHKKCPFTAACINAKYQDSLLYHPGMRYPKSLSFLILTTTFSALCIPTWSTVYGKVKYQWRRQVGVNSKQWHCMTNIIMIKSKCTLKNVQNKQQKVITIGKLHHLKCWHTLWNRYKVRYRTMCKLCRQT